MTLDRSNDVPLRTHVFTTPMREFGSDGKHWSPCASTLVTGETDAVLTDTGRIKSDVSALGDMIEQTGTRLTTIYITHGHLDTSSASASSSGGFRRRGRLRRPQFSPTSRPRSQTRRSSGSADSVTASTRPRSSRSRSRAT
jgi:glyoxylase-like metal-dependent hydrolase (beta-lactamase superfamily II)